MAGGVGAQQQVHIMTEQSTTDVSSTDLLRMTADLVAAYVGNNTVATKDLPEVISAVHASLASVEGKLGAGAENLKPAVSIRKSVTPEYIICLEDGIKRKMLKRHLRTSYDMTPDQYRAKWQLGSDYPMVAPNYSEWRSEFAKKIGLGHSARRQRGRRTRKSV